MADSAETLTPVVAVPGAAGWRALPRLLIGGALPGRRWARLRLLAAVAYLAVVFGTMISRGLFITIDQVVVWFGFLVLVLMGLRGFLRFARDWIPFAVLLLGYESMRDLASGSHMPLQVTSLIKADSALFFGNVPTIWLQAHLYHPGSAAWYDVTFMFVYFLHFAFPVGLAFLLWTSDRALYVRYATTLILVSFSAFVFFMLVPSAPPWMAAQMGQLPTVYHVLADTMGVVGAHNYLSGTYEWMQLHFNPNMVAAFPSLHGAYPVLALLYAVERWGKRASLALIYVAVVWMAVVYMGEHYVVDVLAGGLLAVVYYLASDPLYRRLGWGQPAAPALPPLRAALEPSSAS